MALSLPDASSTEEDGLRRCGDGVGPVPSEAWLRRLMLAGVCLPVLFIVGLQLMRPYMFDRWWPQWGDMLTSLLTAGAAVAFGVVMFVFIRRGHRQVLLERDRLRDAERNAAIVSERLCISREMHDSLAQVIAVTHLRLRGLSARPDMPASVSEEMSDLADVCEEAYGDVRETIHGLREAARHDRDVFDAMYDYVQWFGRQTAIDVCFRLEPSTPRLTGDAATHALRVVQEALTNVRKHSGACQVDVTVEVVPRAEANAAGYEEARSLVRLTIRDDGCGFDLARIAPSEHYGLKSMRERAEAVGGDLTVESWRGGGTCVSIDIPGSDERNRATTWAGPDDVRERSVYAPVGRLEP